MKRTPGDYALLHANGTSFAEIVKMIRDEQARYIRIDGKEFEVQDSEVQDRIEDSYNLSVWVGREAE